TGAIQADRACGLELVLVRIAPDLEARGLRVGGTAGLAIVAFDDLLDGVVGGELALVDRAGLVRVELRAREHAPLARAGVPVLDQMKDPGLALARRRRKPALPVRRASRLAGVLGGDGLALRVLGPLDPDSMVVEELDPHELVRAPIGRDHVA